MFVWQTCAGRATLTCMANDDPHLVRFYKAFGLTIQQAREAAGLAQADLADRIGMSRASVANIERGAQRPPLHVAISACDALGLPIAEVVAKARAARGTPRVHGESATSDAAVQLAQMILEGGLDAIDS